MGIHRDVCFDSKVYSTAQSEIGTDGGASKTMAVLDFVLLEMLVDK